MLDELCLSSASDLCHVSEIKTQGNFPLCKGIYLKLFGSTGCTVPFQSHA